MPTQVGGSGFDNQHYKNNNEVKFFKLSSYGAEEMTQWLRMLFADLGLIPHSHMADHGVTDHL